MARQLSILSFLHLFVALVPCVTQAKLLIQGPTIATWNDTSQAIEVYRGASVLVDGDKVCKIYKSGESVASDAKVVNATGKILVPGFISTHQHVWQTLYKTLIPNLPFATYFPRLSHLAPISESLSAEDVYRSELMGALELLSEGTTSWIDITAVLSPETVNAAWRATFASGGRSFFAATLADRPTFSEADQLAQMRELARRPELKNSSLVTLGLGYDGFEAASATSREAVVNLAKSGDIKFITTHYVGGPFGNTNSPELLNRAEWSLLNGSLPVVFSHSSYMTPLDASLLRSTNQYVSTNPESELHAGIGHPYAHLIQDQAALAADSVFAFSTSMVGQARLWLQSVRGRLSELLADQWRLNTNTPMTVNQAFYLATRAGGLALRRPDLGIIAEGAKADFVIYDTSKPDLIGWRDPVAAVILHSNPGDISDVMVGGKFVKRNFKLTFKDMDRLTSDFKESARTFEELYYSTDFGAPPHWFTLAQYQDAQQVDAVRGNATGY